MQRFPRQQEYEQIRTKPSNFSLSELKIKSLKLKQYVQFTADTASHGRAQ